MTNKKYSVILADPPWSYNNEGVRGVAVDQYSTMNLEELMALDIDNLAARDCVLLMWATWPKLDEACLPLLKAWGFEYVTGFPYVKITEASYNLWKLFEIKVPYGIGFWVRGASEPLLIGRRGNPSPPPNGFIGLLSPNLYHSRKPDNIYDYAESMPGPYLELFARRRRAGWDAFGNEIEGSIELIERGRAVATTGLPGEVRRMGNEQQGMTTTEPGRQTQLRLDGGAAAEGR